MVPDYPAASGLLLASIHTVGSDKYPIELVISARLATCGMRPDGLLWLLSTVSRAPFAFAAASQTRKPTPTQARRDAAHQASQAPVLLSVVCGWWFPPPHRIGRLNQSGDLRRSTRHVAYGVSMRHSVEPARVQSTHIHECLAAVNFAHVDGSLGGSRSVRIARPKTPTGPASPSSRSQKKPSINCQDGISEIQWQFVLSMQALPETPHQPNCFGLRMLDMLMSIGHYCHTRRGAIYLQCAPPLPASPLTGRHIRCLRRHLTSFRPSVAAPPVPKEKKKTQCKRYDLRIVSETIHFLRAFRIGQPEVGAPTVGFVHADEGSTRTLPL
ncbi:hypothetical protein LZ30DRAFT_221036 [Colletotrichum cereale]|nr:hypothetical protein LZ30DRAFT_221036 [Colletotrichum cereale]